MENNKEIHLSLVLPVYNAASFIEHNVKTVLDYLDSQPYSSELLLVDDGSGDNTLELLNRISSKKTILKILTNGRNRGKGYTVGRGAANAHGKYIIFCDADLAYPVEETGKILKTLEKGSDVAIACRVLRESRYEISPAFFRYLYTRHIMGRFFNFLVRMFILPGILDTQAGLKGFTQEATGKIFPKQTLQGFSFDVELLYLAKKLKLKIQQVPINFRYFFEESTVRFFRDTLQMIRDLLSIKLNDWKGRYS